MDGTDVILWINGSFGSGKTHTAFELVRRLGRGQVRDPELAGMGLQRLLPTGHDSDFQDFAAWRAGVREVLALGQQLTDELVVVPMSLVVPAYFDEIIGGLRRDGVEVRHVTLQAIPQTLRRRLAGRGGQSREQWGIERASPNAAALSDALFAEHVVVDDLTLDEVVEEIARRCALALIRPRLGPIRARIRRMQVLLAHIRRGWT